MRKYLFVIGCALGFLSNVRAQDLVTEFEALIFPLQGQHVHSSSIVELPNGDLLAAWFQGSGERTADDVVVNGARWSRSSGRWSDPFLLADTPGIPDCNPVLFLNHEGTLFLVWIAVQSNGWQHSILRVRQSDDYQGSGAPTWRWQDNILLKPGPRFAREVKEKFKQLPPSGHGWAEYAQPYDRQIMAASEESIYRSLGWMTRTTPLLMGNGRILLPLYSDGLNMGLIAISDDDGKSWRPSLPIVGRGPIQPALARRSNGDIVAYMRDSGDEPSRVQLSLSTDDGESWSAAEELDIPNTASVNIRALENGDWIFVGNDVDGDRNQLSVCVSTDEGRTWPARRFVEKVKRGEGRFSYPCLIQASDGRIHLTYSYHLEDQKSIKHVIFDSEQIK